MWVFNDNGEGVYVVGYLWDGEICEQYTIYNKPDAARLVHFLNGGAAGDINSARLNQLINNG